MKRNLYNPCNECDLCDSCLNCILGSYRTLGSVDELSALVGATREGCGVELPCQSSDTKSEMTSLNDRIEWSVDFEKGDGGFEYVFSLPIQARRPTKEKILVIARNDGIDESYHLIYSSLHQVEK